MDVITEADSGPTTSPDSPSTFMVGADETMFDLSNRFTAGEKFVVSMTATNMVGISNESNTVEFEARAGQQGWG